MNPAELFRHDTDALQLAPGDSLFRQGDKGEKVYVLLEGEMEIVLGDFVLETAGPGALIGEMALIDDSQRSGEDLLPAGGNRSTSVPFSCSADAAFRDARDENTG
jgi:CRP-like cAMP-binding protein